MRAVGWTFFYMFVVLKIPILFAFWLIWWATRAPEPQEQERSDDDGGGSRRERHPRGRPPRPPRRGPHAEPAPPAPLRTRVVAGKLPDSAHR
jgi:hypothetical protein